jgi:hypothetical protein
MHIHWVQLNSFQNPVSSPCLLLSAEHRALGPLVLLLFDLECSSFVLINHATLHIVITHATIPMSPQDLNPR